MSFKIMADVCRIEGVTSMQKFVLLMLADRANDDGYCFPSLDRIAKDCCINTRATVTKHIKVLEDLGYIEIIHRKDGNVCLSNVYRIKPIGVVQNLNRGSSKNEQGVVQNLNTNLSVEPINKPISNISVPKDTKRKIFKAPEASEVEEFLKEYLTSLGSISSAREMAEDFWDYYDSKDWLVGKTKMKNWQAAARRWARNNNKKSNGGSTPRRGI